MQIVAWIGPAAGAEVDWHAVSVLATYLSERLVQQLSPVVLQTNMHGKFEWVKTKIILCLTKNKYINK